VVLQLAMHRVSRAACARREVLFARLEAGEVAVLLVQLSRHSFCGCGGSLLLALGRCCLLGRLLNSLLVVRLLSRLHLRQCVALLQATEDTDARALVPALRALSDSVKREDLRVGGDRRQHHVSIAPLQLCAQARLHFCLLSEGVLKVCLRVNPKVSRGWHILVSTRTIACSVLAA